MKGFLIGGVDVWGCQGFHPVHNAPDCATENKPEFGLDYENCHYQEDNLKTFHCFSYLSIWGLLEHDIAASTLVARTIPQKVVLDKNACS